MSSPPIELHDGGQSYYSPSGKRLIKFVQKDIGGEDSMLLAEVWTVGGGLDRVWEIPADVHGGIFCDEWFGHVSWSPDESMVVYVADYPRSTEKLDDGEDDDPMSKWKTKLRNKFSGDARDPMGEAYINKRSPHIIVAFIEEGRSVLISDPKNMNAVDVGGDGRLFGEPVWSADGRWIVATMRRASYVTDEDVLEGEHVLPYDLGIRYCYNRFSAIVAFPAPDGLDGADKVAGGMRVVSSVTDSDDFCCNSPRFSPDGSALIYVTTPREADAAVSKRVSPHNMTRILRTVAVREGGFSTPRTVVGIPDNPAVDEFPGLYLHSLPDNPWLDDDVTLVFNSVWGSLNKILSVEFGRTPEGELEVPEPLPVSNWQHIVSDNTSGDTAIASKGNASVVDVVGDKLLVSASDPSHASQLFVISCKERTVTPVSTPTQRTSDLSKYVREVVTRDLVAIEPLSCDSHTLPARIFRNNEDLPHIRFQTTVILPNTESPAPLVVFPHGGPHTSTLNGYATSAMALIQAGYAVQYMNYRGSLGLGQKSLETLPGNIGTQDINEVMQGTRWALAQPQFNLHQTQVAFIGGSHSGFQGAHVSLLNLFKRIVLRNPVVDLSSMVGASDIPDWCFCEAGVPANNGFIPDTGALAKMLSVSPISRLGKGSSVDKTLLQVGGGDRRVPPAQSLLWRRLVNTFCGGGVEIRWYPRCGHALDEVVEGDDSWVCALEFLDGMKGE